MRISEALKEMYLPESRIVPVDEYGYWNINVGFRNSESRHDETQFDIVPACFDTDRRKCRELEELWKEFCRENGFRTNSVEYAELAN